LERAQRDDGILVQVSLRSPQRSAAIALWFQVGLAGLGVLAKFTSLIMKK
jgi:hypothetical protein